MLTVVGFLDRARSVLAFFTVIPVGGSHDVSAAFSSMWLSTLIVPPVTGFLPGLVTLAPVDPLLRAALAYSLLLLLTGFHHIDGAVDVGDALMIRGSVEDRLRVLRDPRRGTGGVLTAVILVLVPVSALYSMGTALFALYSSEVASKAICHVCAYLGREPPYRGLGYEFVVRVRESGIGALAITLSASLTLVFATMSTAGLFSLLVSLFSSLLIFRLIEPRFGGAVGDLFGFILEFSRVVYLVAVSLVW
jgi:adenosylcobinamide-GDP ribazoletransferase